MYVHDLLMCIPTLSYYLKYHTSRQMQIASWVIHSLLFQAETEAEAEQEEGTDPPPTKRLRSDELTRVIVISPDGQRHQLDIARQSTMKVGDLSSGTKWSFGCVLFTINIINQIYAQDHNICCV